VDGAYKKIGLLDHMGYGNMGDAAVQEAFIANIKRRLPNAVLIGFSLNPDDTRKRHNIASYPIRWCHPGWKGTDAPQAQAKVFDLNSKLKSYLKRCRILYVWAKPIHDFMRELAHLMRSYDTVRFLDILIISGGGQLSELWREMPYNVFKFCLLAKLSRTPLLIVGVGAGPLERPSSKFFARWSVRLANYTSFRDVESQTLLRNLGVKTQTHVCPDPAYALDLRDYVTGKPSNTLTARIGLNPMGFCDPRVWPRKDEAVYGRYLDKLAAFSSWLLAQNYHLEIFTSDSSVDLQAIADLKKRLIDASPNGSSKVAYRPVACLKELLVQMSTFDFVITSKFHGVVFSHLLAKPVIGLSYHPKIDDLMRTVGHLRYCLPIEHFDVDSLIETFQTLVHNGDDLRSLFRKTAATYADALQVEFDNCFSAARRFQNERGPGREMIQAALDKRGRLEGPPLE
jgi:polysaccharide pyruvyl transferase WcaK-like protein